MKTKKTSTVGVLIPSLENIFSTSIVSKIENILLQFGYSTIICDYQQNKDLESQKLNFLINKSVDGIIFMPLGIDGKKIAAVIERDIPVVLIDRPIRDFNCAV